MHVMCNRFFSDSGVFLYSGCCPAGTEGVNVDFDHKQAYEAKDAGTASETKSQPEERVFMVLVNFFCGF